MFYFAKMTFESDTISKSGLFTQEVFFRNLTSERNFQVWKGPYTRW